MSTVLTDNAIKQVADLAKESVRSSIVKLAGDRADVHRLIKPDGSVEILQTKPTPPVLSAGSLADFVRSVNLLVGTEHKNSGIFVNADGVQFVTNIFDTNHLFGKVVHEMEFTPAFKFLHDGPHTLSQEDLYRLLRGELRKTTGDIGLAEIIRKVNFTKMQSAGSEISNTRVSVDKSIVAEVTGTSKIPEIVTVRTPVFATFGDPVLVECSLDADLMRSQFIFKPLPGEVDAAIRFAVEAIIKELLRLSAELKIEIPRPLYGCFA